MLFRSASGSGAVLLQLGTNPPPGELSVYYRPNSNITLVGYTPDNTLRDPAPVALKVLRPPGVSAPTCWEELRVLQAHAGSGEGSGFTANIGELDAPPLMADIRTILACPTTGTYRFAIGAMNAAGVLAPDDVRVPERGRLGRTGHGRSRIPRRAPGACWS